MKRYKDGKLENLGSILDGLGDDREYELEEDEIVLCEKPRILGKKTKAKIDFGNYKDVIEEMEFETWLSRHDFINGISKINGISAVSLQCTNIPYEIDVCISPNDKNLIERVKLECYNHAAVIFKINVRGKND